MQRYETDMIKKIRPEKPGTDPLNLNYEILIPFYPSACSHNRAEWPTKTARRPHRS